MPLNPSPFPSPAPRWSRPLRTSGACLLAILVMACGGGGGSSTPPPAPPPAATALTSITLAPSGPTLNVGASVDVQATGHFSDGTTVTPYDSQVTWTSSAPGTASVSASGLVNGVAAGTANITAAKGPIQGSATVTVQASTAILTSITLNPAAGVTLNVGQTVDFTATANWSNGTSTTPYDSSVIWTTNLPNVATVNSAGVVTAVAAGSATLTASANGLNTTAAITVRAAAAAALTGLTMLQSTSSLQVGQTTGIIVMARWSDGTTTTPYTTGVTWASSNSAVATATLNATGCTVTAVSVGTVNITATASGYTSTAGFGVSAPTPTFDARLVGSWRWLDAAGEYGSFYVFNANGTFTYSLIYTNRSGCIAYSQVVASHQGTFSSQGSLDNPASAGQVIFNCTSHFTDYTNCAGSISRFPWSAANPHFHWAAFINATTLATNHSDDFQATGTLNHAKQ